MIVVDASMLVAQQVNGGRDGDWARAVVDRAPLLAPHHCPAEAVNSIRRLARRGLLGGEEATEIHRSLMATKLTLFDYRPFAGRIWELRHNVGPYDAWYVALAEIFGAPLATCDLRLAGAPATRCEFLTPP